MLDFVLDPVLVKPEQIVARGRLLSRRAYDQLVARGVFDDERIELLRGRLVVMSPQGNRHATIAARLAQHLIRALNETYEVRSHSPFAATDDSEPEPDVSVTKRRDGFYHPAKALLLIEVANSSLETDRQVKAEIYAENGAPEYWVVDLQTKSVFVHTHPKHGRYQTVVQLRRKAVLRPVRLPGVELGVSDLFARRFQR
jgi:Uma2 family endonuclease